jgi:hypothetical protein
VQLFGGDGEYDPSSSFYYHDKRWRQTHRFVSMDSYEGSLADPLSLHKYLYASANPIFFGDPSGHNAFAATIGVGSLFADLVMSVGLRIVAFGPYAAAAAAGGLAAYGMLKGINAALAAKDEILDLLSSGEQSLVRAAMVMMSNTQVVAKAISDAVSKAGAQLNNLKKVNIYPIILSMGPAVYALDVAALTFNPAWSMLTYNGPGSPRTPANRAAVMGAFKGTVPPGQHLDEFPYASTRQGGRGAFSAPVPWQENARQGGLLSAFYRLKVMPSGNMNFLVVPIPL